MTTPPTPPNSIAHVSLAGDINRSRLIAPVGPASSTVARSAFEI